MRELYQIWEFITTFVSSFRWNAQSVSMFVIAALVLAVVTAAQMDQSPPSDLQPLFANRTLTQSELEQIEAALGDAELSGYRVVQGQLHVSPNQRARYFAALKQAGCLPESFHAPTSIAIRSTNIIETFRQQTQRMQHAKERETELLIRAIQGVEDAYVRFDETAGFGLQGKKLSTAMVGVTTKSGQPLDPRSVHMIQEMLLGLKAGLTVDDITVTDLTAGQSFRSDVGQSSSPYGLVQHNLEYEWTRKLFNILSFIPEAKIAVHVEADAEKDTVAKVVRVSVGVPSEYVTRLKITQQSLGGEETTLSEIEEGIRSKIQAVILPLLPGTSGDASRFVAVNIFDVPSDTATARSSPWHEVFTSPLIGLSVLVLIAGIAAMRFISGRQPAKPHAQLRVYSSDQEDTTAATNDELETLRLKLRAYVEEDPDAAAKSLAEFIDRAS